MIYPLTINYDNQQVGAVSLPLTPELTSMLTEGDYIIAPAYIIHEDGTCQITEFSIIPYATYNLSGEIQDARP